MDKGKNKAKSLKLGKNDIICPGCNTVLNISDELKNDELIQCTNCEAAINNPLFFSGKFVMCLNCGNNAELPKNIENELMVHCSICSQDIFNPHSDNYNAITCPHCFIETHVPNEILHERYLQCPNCQNDFKNTLRQKKNNSIQANGQNNSNSEQNTISNSNSIVDEPINLTKKQKNWIAGIVIFVIILLIGYVNDNSSSTDYSNSEYTVNQTTYVATSKSSFDEMFRYINDGDNQALSTIMSYGQVQTLSAGTNVNLVSSHFSYCIVRLKGSTQKVWIVTEHITKK